MSIGQGLGPAYAEEMKSHALALLLLTTPLLFGQTTEEIRGFLINRVDEGKKVTAIVVGTIDEKGRNVVAYGHFDKDDARTPDGNTIFEIGSITKVFTSLVLADMVERGEVKLDDPVAKYLPDSVKVPGHRGRQITLRDLSMQVSGLPRIPSNFKPANPMNPYADYDAAKLYEFLSGYTLARDPGEKYEYSNLAVGLLGTALARRDGTTYETMVRKRVLDPLGMRDTTVTLTEDQKKRLAPGHDAGLDRVKNWDFDAIAGAGAVRSTANDMMTFLAAHMELTAKVPPELKAAMQRMRAERRDTGTPEMQIAMGWHIFTNYGTEIVWHNGGTGGYRSFAGFDPAKKKGVVVLCNTFFDNDDLGRHILEPKWPVAKMAVAVERKQVALDAKVLQEYAGVYEIAGAALMTVTVEDGHTYVQITGQPRFEAFAEKRDEFFLKVVDAQITFVRNDAGAVTSLVLHQNGREIAWQRK
jgi:serine-type D-Ala-D-Ala carboxypeptidase/endopeptidase